MTSFVLKATLAPDSCTLSNIYAIFLKQENQCTCIDRTAGDYTALLSSARHSNPSVKSGVKMESSSRYSTFLHEQMKQQHSSNTFPARTIQREFVGTWSCKLGQRPLFGKGVEKKVLCLSCRHTCRTLQSHVLSSQSFASPISGKCVQNKANTELQSV